MERLGDDYRPEFDSLKTLLLEMAGELSLEALLKLIVNRLAARPHIALVRIWLIEPGDICESCHMRDKCPDQTHCLHLVASAGRSVVDPNETWDRLDGRHRRIPLGVRRVGRVATTGETLAVWDIEKEPDFAKHPDWVRREGFRGFGGAPLICKGKVLGVLAIFTRIPLVKEGPIWARIIADLAAAMIGNAQAFDQIDRLKSQLEAANEYLREEVSIGGEFARIVGQSAALRSTLEQIELVAPTDASVLILGESGTGKELVAREIHNRSRRHDGPMVKVNCAAIPRELYESEFFGHVKGAFTGAVRDRAGRFETADGGTLFLDEVGEIPLDLQTKLLRVLQEGQFERIGEEGTRRADVRIVAATNRDLKEDVEARRFRQDLYYRLNVFPVEIAPLRQRKEDIPLLAEHFLKLACDKAHRPALRLTQANIIALQQYDWPGNVRELQNVIERAVITARQGMLRFDLPSADPAEAAQTTAQTEHRVLLTCAQMKQAEKDNVLAALEAANWKIAGPNGAAELLGVKPTTLVSRLKAMGIRQRR